MFDGVLRQWIDPALNRFGGRVAARGWRADQVTLAGFVLGLVAAGLLAGGAPGGWALMALLANRLADGLDGAVARARAKTDFGGFLDIVADFALYGMVPLAFALRSPENALPAAFLLVSFYINGASFLAFAILAEKNGMTTVARGDKSLYFTAGLMEGFETLLILAAMCLWPWFFAPLAWGFGALCLVTASGRIALARRSFRV